MRTIRTVVVDDEAPARAKLRRLLAAEEGFKIVGEAASGDDALRVIRGQACDVVFLDVQMPGLDGFGVVEALGDAVPYVVFVTAHEVHAIQAFEVRALDYLLKPVTPKRFRATAARLREQLSRGALKPTLIGDLREIAASLATHTPHLERVLVHDEMRAFFLPVDRIDWIDADRNYVRIHAGVKVFTDRTTIGALAARLNPAKFLRVNRSQIVRVDAVKEMYPWSHGDHQVVLMDGTRLTWSRRYRATSKGVFWPTSGHGA